MVAIHLPRPADEWAPAPGAPDAGADRVPGVVVRSPRRPLPDRATRIRRRRLVALVGAMLLASLLAVGLQALAGLGSVVEPGPAPTDPPAVGADPAPLAGSQYVVQPGDTLWSIAAAIAPDDDPRAVVDALRAANGGADLQVGDRLDLDIG